MWLWGVADAGDSDESFSVCSLVVASDSQKWICQEPKCPQSDDTVGCAETCQCDDAIRCASLLSRFFTEYTGVRFK
jgi:hypothetical protein